MKANIDTRNRQTKDHHADPNHVQSIEELVVGLAQRIISMVD